MSLDELPTNDFKVVPIKGLSIAGHIDPRSQEVGYLCLIGKDVPQKHFFDWFYEEITCKTVKVIRELHNPISTPTSVDDEIPAGDRFTMWGDSDIPYLQTMTSPARIENSIKKGIYFAKIGAKITENSQPLDLGPFFKILKICGKTMSSIGTDKPFAIIINALFKRLRKDGILKLSTLKERSLIDLLVTTPEMIAAAFSKHSIVKSFGSAGMLDDVIHRCPDLYGLIASFKIAWQKVTGGKKWFINECSSLISEMYHNGEVSEEYYDEKNYPLDRDKEGNIWRLNSNADHLTRSKVMYHPTVIAKKNSDIRMCLEAKTSKELKAYQDAKTLFEVNKDIEVKLLNGIQEQRTQSSLSITPSLSLCTLEMFDKLKVPELTAFYRCRVQVDLKMKFACPAKGTVVKVRSGEVDKKTKGPLLIQCCHDVKSLPVIASDPVQSEVESTEIVITPPHVIDFLSENNALNFEVITNDWMKQVPNIFHLVMNAVTTEFVQHIDRDWESTLKYVDILSRKLVYRMYSFLKLRLPLKRTDLQPGRHWVWDSFKVKSKKIAAIMILNGHIVNQNKLIYRTEDESLFNCVTSFKTFDIHDANSECDGNYVVVDTERSSVIRSGAAEVGILRRWKEHRAASMLIDHSNRTNKFYSSYPNALVTNKDLLSASNVKGMFQHLSVRLGIGMKRNMKTELVKLFDWNYVETNELTMLNGNGNRKSMDDKKYRHLCYMFELAYALAIDPNKNVSSSAGCEWQMGHFG